MKSEPCNDNEPGAMIPIGLAALEILNRLQTNLRLRELCEKQAAQRDERAEEVKEAEDGNEQARRYIEQRLSDRSKIERRACGE